LDMDGSIYFNIHDHLKNLDHHSYLGVEPMYLPWGVKMSS
jgi:hypothetical protein